MTIEVERLVRLLVQARVMAALVVVVLSALVLVPDWFKLDRWFPFVQVVAFRPIFAAAAMILGAVMLTFRWAWPCAVGLLGVGVLAAVAVLPRSIPSAEPAFSGRELSVLSFNVYNGRVDAAALAQIIQDRSPDLVALPEAGQGFRERLDHELVAQGYHSWSSRPAGESDVDSVTALAAPWLGVVDVEVGTHMRYPYLVLSGGSLGRVRFVAFHAVAPVRGATDQWRHDLSLLPQWCDSSTPSIVAGDFNATLDHSVLRDSVRGCSDAAARRGRGLVGTWPSRWPRWLAAPIDHVLGTAGIEALEVDVLDVPGSDHRALFARLRVPH